MPSNPPEECGFFHREALGLERQGSLLDGDEFSERTDPKSPAELDLIACRMLKNAA